MDKKRLGQTELTVRLLDEGRQRLVTSVWTRRQTQNDRLGQTELTVRLLDEGRQRLVISVWTRRQTQNAVTD